MLYQKCQIWAAWLQSFYLLGSAFRRPKFKTLSEGKGKLDEMYPVRIYEVKLLQAAPPLNALLSIL